MASDNDFDIPGYRIERLIGRGGMAEVYIAVQQSLNREVALKVLLPSLSNESGFAARFEREATTAAALRHPNIIKIFDTGQHDGRYFIAMEYLGDKTLKDLIHQGMSTELAVHFMLKLASALEYAHRHGVIHRDIKPTNVLLYGDTEPVLSDFGISRLIDSNSTLTATGVAMGSPRYMSPEQARGQKVDHRSDLYALGVVFYEMLTGKLPFDADDSFALMYMHVHDPPPRLPPKLAHYQWVLDKLMAKKPDERFADASELIHALGGLPSDTGIFDDKTVIVPPSELHTPHSTSAIHAASNTASTDHSVVETTISSSTTPPQHQKKKKKSSIIWLALVSILAVTSGGAYWFFFQPAPLPLVEAFKLPDSLPETIRLLEENLRQENYPRAQKLLQHGLAKDPLNPELLQLAQKVRAGLERQRLRQQAENLKKSALEALNQNDFAAVLEQADALDALAQQYEPARPQARQLRQHAHKLLQQKAQADLQADRLQSASQWTQQGQRLFPNDPLWAQLHEQIEKRKQTLLEQQLEQQFKQVQTALQTHDFEQAQTALTQAKALAPQDPRIARWESEIEQTRKQWAEQHLQAAQLALAQGHLPQAEQRLSQAKQAGASPQALAQLQKQLQQAKALATRKQHFAQLIEQAKDALERNQLTQARQYAQQAHKLNIEPKQTQALLARIESIQIQQRLEQQRQNLRSSLKQAISRQDFAQARRDLQALETAQASSDELEKWHRTIQNAEEANKKQSKADAYLQQAEILLEQKRWQAALDAVAQALNLLPQYVPARQLQQQIQQARKQHRNALENEFQAALQQNQIQRAQSLLDQLKQNGLAADEQARLREQLQTQITQAIEARDIEQAQYKLKLLAALEAPKSQLNALSQRIEATIQQAQEQARLEHYFEQARQALQHKQWENAQNALRQAAALRPGHPELQRLQEAYQHAQKTEQQALQTRFQHALTQADWKQSEHVLEQLVTLGMSPTKIQRLRQALDDAKQRQMAEKQLQQHLEQARRASAQQHWKKARQALAQAQRQAPQNPRVKTLGEQITHAEEQYFIAERQAILELLDSKKFDAALKKLDSLRQTLPDYGTQLSQLRQTIEQNQTQYQQQRQRKAIEQTLQRIARLRNKGQARQAIEHYRTLLAQAERGQLPDDLKARIENENQAFVEHARKLAQKAQKLAQKHAYDAARYTVQQALDGLPQHPDNQTYRNQLKQQLARLQTEQQTYQAQKAAEQKQHDIQQKLQRARRLFAARKLTSPKGNNAYETVQEILALDPHSKEALALLDEISATYWKWAQSKRKKGQLQSSLKMIERALKVSPNTPKYQAFKNELLAAIQTERKRAKTTHKPRQAPKQRITEQRTPKPVQTTPQKPAQAQTAPKKPAATPQTQKKPSQAQTQPPKASPAESSKEQEKKKKKVFRMFGTF